jgi:uncharacterized heparinase superfamily protein
MSRQHLTGLGRTARTVAHLRPAQIAHRARLRAQRAALARWPELGRRLLAADRARPATGQPARGAAPASGTGAGGTAGPGGGGFFPAGARWPTAFVPVDARLADLCPAPAELRSGRITLLGQTGVLDWHAPGSAQLWRFHVHYWDWAWSLAADPDRAAARELFGALWRSWKAGCAFGRGDAWLPYPAALRAWSWCGLHRQLVAGTSMEPEFTGELAAHARFLRWHLESDVGGNHLIKGLKALAGLGVFLGDERLVARAARQLRRQVAVQVLADGGHYERAPAYHSQVLGDLIDVAGLLRAAGRPADPELDAAITRMRQWLSAVLAPDGTVPLLNDGYPVPAALVAALLADAPPPGMPRQQLLVLPDTGLVRAAAGGWHLLADVGAPCPPELPAHAHADTLGCLVHAGGAPLLVDTGTSTYAAGPVRDYERSTAAHSTVEIDGCNSTEVWGAFRAGRRARVRDTGGRAGGGTVTVQAAHDGYRWLAGHPDHRRRWQLDSDGLRVDDEIAGGGRHAAAVRWHLAPGAEVLALTRDSAVIATGPPGALPGSRFAVTVTAGHSFRLGVEQAPVAAGFGRTSTAPVLTCRFHTALPARVSTCWRRAGARQEAA